MDSYEWIKADLETLKSWSGALIAKLPPVGSPLSDDLYLQSNAIQIGIVSQLEYFLQSQGKIKKQSELLNIIKNSRSLSGLQKDNLVFLVLVRHTLVHNGGYYDNKFIEDCKKHITKLKIEGVKEGLLSTLPFDDLPLYIDLVSKLIEEIKQH